MKTQPPALWRLGTSLQQIISASILVLLLAVVWAPASAGQAVLPEGVPNIFDAEVRANFEPVAVINLRGNPDFPMLILVHKAEEEPQAMVIGLDARNGKDTWSLASDPIILIVLFSDPSTISAVHVDAGFSEKGKPSGTYMALEHPASLTLPDVFEGIAAAPVRTYM
ncbi:MAG TPA: hypothetical protein VLG48_03060 [Candidatus Methylomirabilis sp.]|nr:hypothetical protein [Candidatus Methylomirabilis sp.]